MLVDRHAAAVVGDGQPVAGLERDLDPGGMAGDRLVHRIVEHLGGEMMQRALVGAADIHARPAADGLEPLQHLDRGGVVIGGARALEANRSDMAVAIEAQGAAAKPGRASMLWINRPGAEKSSLNSRKTDPEDQWQSAEW